MKKILFFVLALTVVGFVACGGDGLDEVFAEASMGGDGSGGGSGSGSSGSSGSSSSKCSCYTTGNEDRAQEYNLSQYSYVNVETCNDMATYFSNVAATYICTEI